MSRSFFRLRTDFGIARLSKEWRGMLSMRYLRQDVLAGITVAFVAVPLSLAIALASGVEPAVGLVTAIVAGIVCAFFGGTTLAVSGPAAAMAVLIAANVEKFGVTGLVVIGLGCGLLQILFGTLGLGRMIRFIPTPVVTGFTAGIGVIILIGQLPRALGLPPPDQNHTVEVVKHLFQLIEQAKWAVVMLAGMTIVIARYLPRLFPALPAPLIAVLVPSLVVYFFKMDVPVIGNIPQSLPAPKVPVFPTEGLVDLAFSTLIVFALASLETLLSSSSLDKLVEGDKHDPDQELIGQGLGNLAVSFFGGIPVTGVVARSALNVRAGGKTRRSAIIHSLMLILAVYAIAPLISQIPIAALAGMLIAVALSMINLKEFRAILRVSKGEAIIYGVTFFTMVFVDLIAGVQAGFVAALFAAALRLGQLTILTHHHGEIAPVRATFVGPITFLSSAKLAGLREELMALKKSRWILDLSRVPFIDSSGAENLVELIREALEAKVRVAIKGASPNCESIIRSADPDRATEGLFALTEYDVAEVVESLHDVVPRERLLSGVSQFRQDQLEHYKTLFKVLDDGQTPHTLFITCADSRIVPNLITSTEPGELFIIRNVGNVIPPAGTDQSPAEGAAIEYAVQVLGVGEIIVCGHLRCGAIAASLGGIDGQKFEHLSKWLEQIQRTHASYPTLNHPDQVAKANVLQQIENVLTYPCVRAAVEKGTLQVRGWVYDLKKSDIWEWEVGKKAFVLVGGDAGERPRRLEETSESVRKR